MAISYGNHTVAIANVGSLGTTELLAQFADIDMFLAPLAVCSASYARHCALRSRTAYTILDSGALEVAIGTECTEIGPDELLDLAMTLGVREVVATDSPHEPRASLMRTCECIEAWHRLPRTSRPRLMVVPHGTSSADWLDNASKLIRRVGTCTVGIPRVLAQYCAADTSLFRVDLSLKLRCKHPDVDVHLLGAGPDFLEELEAVKGSGTIRSVDSTFVHRYAFTGTPADGEYVKPLRLRDSTVPIGYMARAAALAKRVALALT